MFDIPVALFMFKRKDTLLQIIKRIAEVKPSKLYLIADAGRNEDEERMVQNCREAVEQAINWECEIVKYYAKENRGVYENIGIGAQWVLEKERWAIFLEDDNLPEVSFFYYCKNLLEKYEQEPKILWICGTNYMGKYEPDNGASYMFTKHLLPCGWASWSKKFCSYYDGEMKTFLSQNRKKELYDKYENKALFRYQYQLFEKTLYKLQNYRKLSSWDYQMAYSIRINDLYGISPKYNQIKNIGVDELSTHGGTSFQYTMTKRFCGMDSYELPSPLTHPIKIEIDKKYEKKIGKIILPPVTSRIKVQIAYFIKKIIRINKYESLTLYLQQRKKAKKEGR